MKHYKIMLFFWLALPACVLLRMLELCFTVDTATGFFLREYRTVGLCLLILIFVFCAVAVLLSFASHRNPEKPPVRSLWLAIASFLVGGLTAYELFTESFAGTVLPWQLALLGITGVAAVLFFFAYGVSLLGLLHLPPLAAVLPPLYLIVKIICTFTAVSSLALISDNILLLAAYCVSLLFFLSFGKLQNDLDTEKNFKKLLAWGLSGALLCTTQGLSHVLFYLGTGGTYRHTSLSANLSLLGMGIFALVFTLTHFSAKNAAVTTHADP